jgi:hypothetical protein
MGTSDVKVMSLQRDGECVCGAFVPRGTKAGWHRTLRMVICASCLGLVDEPVPVDIGVPGGSLDREYARRMAAREQSVRARHPHIGGLVLRLRPPPSSTLAFAIGAAGEREAAETLARTVGDSALFLYNRRVGPGARGDIDIIAVAAAGVFVIDPKKYAGRKVRATRARDCFVVDGRRRPALAPSMRRHLGAVVQAVREGPLSTASVSAAYCFIGADLPFRRLVVDGVPALGLRGTSELLRQPGPLDARQRAMLHADLGRRFPVA